MALPPLAIHRVTTEQIQRLLERCNARHDHHPITEEQLLAFIKNPSGPIMPDHCLEAKKLPDDWGTGEKAVWDLAVTPDGKPCMVTKFNGKTNAVVCGDQSYTLRNDGSKNDQEYVYEVLILGFYDGGEPALVVTKFAVEDTLSDKRIYEARSQNIVTSLGPPPTEVPVDALPPKQMKDFRTWQLNRGFTSTFMSQPIFESTSLPFERDGCQLYYGVIGRWLYLMVAPETGTRVLGLNNPKLRV